MSQVQAAVDLSHLDSPEGPRGKRVFVFTSNPAGLLSLTWSLVFVRPRSLDSGCQVSEQLLGSEQESQPNVTMQ